MGHAERAGAWGSSMQMKVAAILSEEGVTREVEGPKCPEVETGPSTFPLLEATTSRLPDSSTSQLFPSSVTAAMAGAPAETGWGLVYTIVPKVVTRMAPPVLSPQQIEQLARELTRDITSELDGTS